MPMEIRIENRTRITRKEDAHLFLPHFFSRVSLSHSPPSLLLYLALLLMYQEIQSHARWAAERVAGNGGGGWFSDALAGDAAHEVQHAHRHAIMTMACAERDLEERERERG